MHEVVNKSFDLAMILSGQDKVYSFIPPHQGGSLDFAFHKKKEFGEKNERRPLVGTVRRLGNTPFPTQRIGSIRHQASHQSDGNVNFWSGIFLECFVFLA